MLKIKEHRFILVGIVVFGVILLGMPTAYAGDETVASDVPEWVGSAVEAVDSDITAEEEGEDIQALGDMYEDLVFTPVNPCVIVDTRYGGGGFISAGSTRHYKVYGSLGDQGGSTCNSPVGAPVAAHLQVIAVNPNGKGNVLVFPYGTAGTAGISINFNSTLNSNLANAGTTKVSNLTIDHISVRANFAGCHVKISVLGYYARPEATPIQTWRPYANYSIAPYNYGSAQADCPSGYTITGGGCSWQTVRSQLNILQDYPVSNGWYCYGWNGTSGPGITSVLRAYAICSRIRGR